MHEIPLPRTIKIGGYDYVVETNSGDDQELDARGLWGEHSEYFRRIRVSSKATPQQFSQAALHEILHAIDSVYTRMELDEKTVGGLSNGLLQVLEQLGVRFVLEVPQ